jgi:hypothetical protein
MVSWNCVDFTFLASMTHFEEVFRAPQWGQEKVTAPVLPALTQPHFRQSRISYSINKHPRSHDFHDLYNMEGTKK